MNHEEHDRSRNQLPRSRNYLCEEGCIGNEIFQLIPLTFNSTNTLTPIFSH